MSEAAPAVHAVPFNGAPAPVQRTLVRKVAEIMGEISRVKKTGHNKFHDYDYVTEADILDAVRMGMSKRALAILPNVIKSEFIPLGKMRLCTLTVAFTLEDGDSGETRIVNMVGEGTDQGDKASYKAMTGAEKYALMKLFLIPTGDDPERDDPRPPAEKPAPAAERPAPRSAHPAPPPGSTPSPAAAAAHQKVTETTASAEHQKALRLRAKRLWERLSKVMVLEEFKAWAAKLTGKESSVEWTVEDLDHLENAAPEIEQTKQP